MPLSSHPAPAPSSLKLEAQTCITLKHQCFVPSANLKRLLLFLCFHRTPKQNPHGLCSYNLNHTLLHWQTNSNRDYFLGDLAALASPDLVVIGDLVRVWLCYCVTYCKNSKGGGPTVVLQFELEVVSSSCDSILKCVVLDPVQGVEFPVHPRAGNGPASKLPSPFHALVSLSHAVARHPRVLASGLPVAVVPASIDTARFDPGRFFSLAWDEEPEVPSANTHRAVTPAPDHKASVRLAVEPEAHDVVVDGHKIKSDALRSVVQLPPPVAAVHLDGEQASSSGVPSSPQPLGPGSEQSTPGPSSASTGTASRTSIEAGPRHPDTRRSAPGPCPWGIRHPTLGATNSSQALAHTVYGFMARCVGGHQPL